MSLSAEGHVVGVTLAQELKACSLQRLDCGSLCESAVDTAAKR
jgi:hypothetical protein